MKRGCVVCKVQMEVPTLKTKYCPVCAIVQQRKRGTEWKRNNTTKRDFDLFCLDCNVSLPINSKGDKKYCMGCLRKRVVQSHRNHRISKNNKEKLDKFYKNIRINFIQSPYFAEIKTLNKVILCENK